MTRSRSLCLDDTILNYKNGYYYHHATSHNCIKLVRDYVHPNTKHIQHRNNNSVILYDKGVIYINNDGVVRHYKYIKESDNIIKHHNELLYVPVVDSSAHVIDVHPDDVLEDTQYIESKLTKSNNTCKECQREEVCYDDTSVETNDTIVPL